MNDYARYRIRDRLSYMNDDQPHYEEHDEYEERDYRDSERRRPSKEYHIRTDYARRPYARDRASGNYNVDYAMAEHRLSRSDLEHWKRNIENEDGTTGAHFNREDVERAAKAANINLDYFGREDFCMAMNMLYSDYCATAKKYGVYQPEFFAELARDFLKDKDFDGDGKEKLMLYYKCIVEKDD